MKNGTSSPLVVVSGLPRLLRLLRGRFRAVAEERLEQVTRGVRLFGIAMGFFAAVIAAFITVNAVLAGQVAVALIGLVLFAAAALHAWLRLRTYRTSRQH